MLEKCVELVKKQEYVHLVSLHGTGSRAATFNLTHRLTNRLTNRLTHRLKRDKLPPPSVCVWHHTFDKKTGKDE